MAKSISDYEIARVEWYDAESFDDWEDIEQDRKLPLVISVGFILEEEDDHIIIVQSLDFKNSKCSMGKTIPIWWIKSIELL